MLFLDIDGVMNRAEYGKDLYEDTYADYCVSLHRPSVEALRKLLIEEPKLKIVWISDWAKCSNEACEKNHCYLDPLYALESFPWLKSRVAGSIFDENHKNTSKSSLIEQFIEDYMVESYAIVDDDFVNDADFVHLSKHAICINPLKSFLEDDIQSIKVVLNLPVDGYVLHKILLSFEQSDSFMVNDQYHCTFDFSKYHGHYAPLFTEFAKDENSPRISSSVDVLVYDFLNCQHLNGMISLTVDKDLSKIRYESTIYVKHIGEDVWEKGSTILKLSGMKKTLKRKNI